MPITEAVLCSRCGRRTKYQRGQVSELPLCDDCISDDEQKTGQSEGVEPSVERKQPGAKAEDR